MTEGQTKCEKAYESIFPGGNKGTVIKTLKDVDGNIKTIREYAPGQQELLESLKDVFGNDIAESIKNFSSYNKPVLFIGSIPLIRGALAYLWYTHGQITSPLVLNCSGLKEDEAKTKISGDWIKSDFTNLEACTYLGNVLFIEDLDPYEGILKWLWSEVQNNKPPGILAISMDNTNNLSTVLLGRFEVIGLEPEKQTTASTQETKGNVFCCNGGRWTIQYETETIYPSDSHYLKYIKHLLENAYPNKFTHDELYLAIEGSPELNASKEQREDAEELGNDEEVAKIKEEINTIEKNGLTYVKRDGKSYEFIDNNQKTKKDTISKGIKRCIKKIKDDSIKAGHNKTLIWEHLNESIKFEDVQIFYMPQKPTDWNQ